MSYHGYFPDAAYIPKGSWGRSQFGSPQPKFTYDDVSKKAIDWVSSKAKRTGLHVVVFGSTSIHSGGASSIDQYARSTGAYHTSARQYGGPPAPVLIDDGFADFDTLTLAMKIAQSNPLVVMESTNGVPLGGWASAFVATDLTSTTGGAYSLSAEDMDAIDRFLGQNGMYDIYTSHKKKNAVGFLGGYGISKEDLASYVVAIGGNKRAYESLMKM